MLVNKKSLIVEEERAFIVIEARLGIKVYKSWSWFTKLASIMLVLYSKVC